jgi:hypothetical protein
VDAGSGYGRLYPAHHMTATVATAALDAFTAEMGAHMGFHVTFKPFIVRSDQGSAFVSHHFREFLQAHQIHQSLACLHSPTECARRALLRRDFCNGPRPTRRRQPAPFFPPVCATDGCLDS